MSRRRVLVIPLYPCVCLFYLADKTGHLGFFGMDGGRC